MPIGHGVCFFVGSRSRQIHSDVMLRIERIEAFGLTKLY